MCWVQSETLTDNQGSSKVFAQSIFLLQNCSFRYLGFGQGRPALLQRYLCGYRSIDSKQNSLTSNSPGGYSVFQAPRPQGRWVLPSHTDAHPRARKGCLRFAMTETESELRAPEFPLVPSSLPRADNPRSQGLLNHIPPSGRYPELSPLPDLSHHE